MGIILGAAALARIDNLFLYLGFVLLILYYGFRNNETGKIISLKLLVVSAGLFISYLPWLIYSYVYTGDLYPLSGKAVRLISLAQLNGQEPGFSNWYSLLLGASVKIIFINNITPLFLLLLLLILVVLFRKGESKESFISKISMNNFLLIAFLGLFAAYNFYIYGYWFYNRYFYPVVLLLIVYCTLIHDYLNMLIEKPKVLKVINTVLIVIVAVSLIIQPQFKRLFYSAEYLNNGYMNIGLWAGKSFKNGTTIGCSQSGAIGYFAQNLKVINLDGVVNRACYESLVESRNMDYIRQAKIDHIIGWPSNFTLIQLKSANFKSTDLTIRGRVGEFKTWGVEWTLAKVNY